MSLTTRQLSTLKTMGIPLWELRPNKLEADVAHLPLSDEMLSQLTGSRCWVISDAIENEQQGRLLHGMMFAIGLEEHAFSILQPEHLASALLLDLSDKVILGLSESAEQIIASHSTNSEIAPLALASHSLSALIAKPSLKADAWHVLKQVKQALNEH